MKENGCNIVSISGGEDPLHNYEKHTDYYAKLIDMLVENNIPLEMHTSYVDNGFPIGGCHRVVYHLQDMDQLYEIKRWGKEKVLWHYIEQNDYNLYYVNGKVYEKFSDIYK